MNEKQLVKDLYESIVLENANIYRNLYEEGSSNDDNIIDYWKNALSLYSTFSEMQKDVFFSIIKTVITDTVSNMLGVIDGSSEIGNKWEFQLVLNGKTVDNDLQDSFLEYVEEIEVTNYKQSSAF